METFSYSKSQDFFSRAANVIPGGIYGHYSPAPLIPATHYPFYTARAEGARFWDVDGNEFIDYMCAFGPMIQGYQNSVVDHAAREQLKSGNLTTGASAVMVELAEYLTGLVSFADWAYFAKTGADVTNYSAMIARDATGRKKIVMIQSGYHGAAPWMQVPGHHGLIEEDFGHGGFRDWLADEVKRLIQDGQVSEFIKLLSRFHPSIIESYGFPIGTWCVSKVTDMTDMVSEQLTEIIEYGNINVISLDDAIYHHSTASDAKQFCSSAIIW